MNIRRILKWLGLGDLMNTSQERHAFVEGIGDGYCPWDNHYEPSDELKAGIRKEHHYYNAGTAIGFASLIFSIAGAVRLILGAIL